MRTMVASLAGLLLLASLPVSAEEPTPTATAPATTSAETTPATSSGTPTSTTQTAQTQSTETQSTETQKLDHGDKNADKEKLLRRMGYTVKEKNGEKMYCKTETPLGSRLGTHSVCRTFDQVMAERDSAQDHMREKVRSSYQEGQ